MQPLDGKIAVVAGATRGAGRGIARMLGAAGATVYCTGRSVRGGLASGPKRPETIEETAELVTEDGGIGIHAQVDHTQPEQVEQLFARVRSEQGRLDILVNDVWGGDALTEWGKTFWKLDPSIGRTMFERAVHSHVITSLATRQHPDTRQAENKNCKARNARNRVPEPAVKKHRRGDKSK